MLPRRAEEPMYLVPSSLVPAMPTQDNQQNNDRQSVPAQFFPGYPMNPQFMPYAPGFMVNTMSRNVPLESYLAYLVTQQAPVPTNTTTTTTNTNEKELQRSATIE